MKTIIINSPTHGEHKVFVDDEDFELVSKYNWCIKKHGNTFYARCTTRLGINKRKEIKMHRLLLGLADPKNVVDHKDHNGLNNQRNNIRICSYSENGLNKTSHKNSSSKYLGVSLKKDKWKLSNGSIVIYKTWAARIRVNGKDKHLGHFKIEKEAAISYDLAAKKYFGEYANVNFK